MGFFRVGHLRWLEALKGKNSATAESVAPAVAQKLHHTRAYRLPMNDALTSSPPDSGAPLRAPPAVQRIIKVRRDYNSWVASETMEDYALRYTPQRFRKWSEWRVANTAFGAASFLILEAVGATLLVRKNRWLEKLRIHRCPAHAGQVRSELIATLKLLTAR